MNLKFAAILMFSLAVAVSGCTDEGKTQRVEGKIIEITSSGFNPGTLTISAGETVTFVNRDTAIHWPASDPHPGHRQYPEKGGCFESKFDACRGLARGETFSFKFDIKGTWTYHDHLNPMFNGTIVVQ